MGRIIKRKEQGLKEVPNPGPKVKEAGIREGERERERRVYHKNFACQFVMSF